MKTLKRIATIHQTPRLLPAARAEALRVWKRMARVSLVFGPPLAVGAWFWLRHLSESSATSGLLLKLLAASLCMPLIMSPHVLVLWHPRWARDVVAFWKVFPRFIQFATGGAVRWEDIRALEIEAPADEFATEELILHLDCVLRHQPRRFSLRCLRAEVDPALLADIRAAIAAGKWREDAPLARS